MSTIKISALPSGNPAQSGDEIPVARGGTSYKITAGSIANLNATTGTSAQLLGSNGSGGFSNVTVGSGLTYSAGTLSTSGGGMVYPGAGIANSTGSAWGTSYTTTGSGTVVVLSAGNPTFSSNINVNSVSVGRGNNNIATNTAIGTNALNAITTGFSNTAVGYNALKLLTVDKSCVAVGEGALASATAGELNVAVGKGALGNGAYPDVNVAIGANCLFNNTGLANVAIGQEAGLASTSCVGNVIVGNAAASSLTIGDFNVIIGNSAASSTTPLTTGSNNIILGYNAYSTTATVSNQITLGNSSIATLRCQVTTITSLSDARDKKDIKDIPAGIAFINRLRPVSFVWNMRDGGKVDVPEFGFIAQELKQAQKDAGVTVPNLVLDDNPDKLEASPATLLPILVKAIQELSAELKVVKAELAALKG
jgi:trimeric autotransporter adhesin